jgi:hypothetical protein
MQKNCKFINLILLKCFGAFIESSTILATLTENTRHVERPNQIKDNCYYCTFEWRQQDLGMEVEETLFVRQDNSSIKVMLLILNLQIPPTKF